MKRNVLVLLGIVLLFVSCQKKKGEIGDRTARSALMSSTAQLEIMSKYNAFYNGVELPDFAKLEQDAAAMIQYIYVEAWTAGQSYYLLVPREQVKQKGRYVLLDRDAACCDLNKLVIQSKYTIYYCEACN